MALGRLEMSARGLDPSRQEQGLCPVCGRCKVADRVEGGKEPLRASAVSQHDPGPPEPPGEVERQERVSLSPPSESSVDVCSFSAREGEMLCLLSAADPAGGACCHVGQPLSVRRQPDRGETRLSQGFQCEGPDAVEEPVPDRVRAGARCTFVIDDHQATRYEAIDYVDGHARRHFKGLQHALGRVHRGPAREGGQGPQASLVVWKQELVAPLDGRLQRPETFRPVTGGVAQDGEAVVKPTGDFLDRQGAGPRGRQLDRQRQSVEGAAQVEHRLVVPTRLEGQPLGGGPTNEELRRVGGSQGSELDNVLSVKIQPDLTGAQDPQVRRRVEQPHDERRDSLRDVFTVVQDDQVGAVP